MRARTLIGAILGGVAGLAACAKQDSTEPRSNADVVPANAVPIPAAEVDTLVQTVRSGVSERGRVVIRDQETFAAFWAQVHATQMPVPDAPTVDFETSMVIAAAMGGKPTGGFSITIEGIDRSGSDLYVTVVETSPGPTCFVTQAYTAPVVALRVPRVTGKVEFLEESRVDECS